MREQGIDMWIIRNDEEPLYRSTSYREHPVFLSYFRQIMRGWLIQVNTEVPVPGYPDFCFFTIRETRSNMLNQKILFILRNLVRKRDPKKIAVSMKNLAIRRQKIGETSQYSIVTTDELTKALGNEYASRSVDSWILGIRWLSTLSLSR